MSIETPSRPARFLLALALALILARPASAQAIAEPPFDFVPAIFDVLRVEAAGSAIIVGVAGPGVTVDLLDGTTIVARAEANARGEWVLMPGQSLPLGQHLLAIRVTTADGRYQVVSDRRIVLEVRAVAGRRVAALIETPRPEDPVTLPALTIEAVAEGPRIVALAGTAAAGALVRVAIDGERIGEAVVDAIGRWRVEIGRPLAGGVYAARATLVERETDRVVAAAELALVQQVDVAALNPAATVGRAAGASVAVGAPPASRTVVVVRGDTLWDLALRYYGDGDRYPEIFGANRALIRTARLIYPGQVLFIP